MAESPIACVLDALDRDQRERRQRLAGELRSAVKGVTELADGFAFELRNDDATWINTAEFITLERRCCPFLGFALESEREQASISLHITGRAGVKEFLRDAFQIGHPTQGGKSWHSSKAEESTT